MQVELQLMLRGFEEHGVEFAGPAPLAAVSGGGAAGGTGAVGTPL